MKPGSSRRWWLGVAAVCLAACMTVLVAATPEETQAADAIQKMSQDGLDEAVDREAQAFAQRFPAADQLGRVLLLQAQARIRLRRHAAALALLKEHLPQAGPLADEFAFWTAEVLREQEQFEAAAVAYRQLGTSYPASSRRLPAAYAEAYCRFRQGDTNAAVALLTDPKGMFTTLAQGLPDAEPAWHGWLLLGELKARAGEVQGIEQALAPLTGRTLPPAVAAERQYLLSRAKVLAGDWPAALGMTTNLWAAGTNHLAPDLAASIALQEGEIWERLQQPHQALRAYERALDERSPAASRALVLDRCVDLASRALATKDGVAWMEAFISRRPQEGMLDGVRLALGELRLRSYQEVRQRQTSGAATPETPEQIAALLQQARTQFDTILTNHPQTALLGRVQLNRGWCAWEAGTNELGAALAAFRTAAESIPRSLDQAVARFKWADCQWRLADPRGALSNYWFVATNYLEIPAVSNRLAGQALYQTVRASAQVNDFTTATAAMAQLLKSDPEGHLADRSELMLGQALTRHGQPAAARALYEDFGRRFTNSVLLPDVGLALARTYEQELAWPAAISGYSSWLATFGNQPGISTALVARASFDLARASYQTKPDTNALALLTGFLAAYPDSPESPLAQYLVGAYYFGQGDYGNAELHFQNRALLQTTNPRFGELPWRARLEAGRAAFARQSYRSAREHFDAIITNGPLHVAASTLPPGLVAEAYLFRGDTLTLEPREGETNNLARFGEAITAFTKITELSPTNELALRAWGRIGECHLQLATQDPKRYEAAAAAFRHAMVVPADITVRSQAECRLGEVCERMAALRSPPEREALENQALDHYLHVLYRQNLQPGEAPDASWQKRAGLSAAAFAESRRKYGVAIGVYQRLHAELPPLQGRFDRKITELRELQAKGAPEPAANKAGP